ANKQLLNAGMKLSKDGKSLVIYVDDSNASYPLTIDPLNHAASWTDNGLGVVASLDVLYGSTVSDARDVNNDGYDDIIIGAPANIDVLSSSVVASTGQAFIYLGSASGPSATPSITLQSSVTVNALFGFSVSSAGDVNNDGFDDVIIGSPTYTDLGSLTLAGRATVYLGSAGGLNTAAPIHRNGGLPGNGLFGYSVSSAGDMNNDGADEVLI